MWFGKKAESDREIKITQQKPISRRGDQQMDYFKATRSKPIPSATSGVESFRAKKKR